MNTIRKEFRITIVVLITMLLGFGCAEVSVEPIVNLDGSGLGSDNKYIAKKTFSHTIDLNSQTSFSLDGINGSINLEAVVGSNQIIISGEKIVSSTKYSNAGSYLKNITIGIDELTNEITVKTIQPKFSNGVTYKVNYTITIPAGLNIIVGNANGSIQLDISQNTSANFSASLVNGSISLHNLFLNDQIETFKSVLGTLGSGEGAITLSTTNGNIDVLGY
ncbi:MAG: hypothetical protein PVF17_10560 [Ignavibacteria bacterium]|jgi:hypothetical protein